MQLVVLFAPAPHRDNLIIPSTFTMSIRSVQQAIRQGILPQNLIGLMGNQLPKGPKVRLEREERNFQKIT